MAQFRIQIYQRATGGIPRDDIVNTFFLDTDLDTVLVDADGAGLLRDAVDLWRSADLPLSNQAAWISGKAYNMSDAEPREPVGEVSWLASMATRPAAGPRDVALCLSYFADRNLPRNRGRMYIGPLPSQNLTMRPDSTLRGALATLAEGISGLGGPNVQWVQYSTVLNRYANVTDYWIDDEWDTQRRRGLVASTRTAGTVSG